MNRLNSITIKRKRQETAKIPWVCKHSQVYDFYNVLSLRICAE